ncbi:uncharacterized protein LOC124635502 [Helicoverpa zea]|uniref:uncharacterized protein LOC124635502 n=1 Tax=Helicoverpa zea TaxID=7113 RepID=UPI001F564DFE|nr:uncharacterized protein LOC124635502 [Helicoverpa zea]
MKVLLYLLAIVKVCSCTGDNEQSSNLWRGIAYDDGLRYDDHHDPIVRPCSLHDVDCIRRFFAHNSKCSPVHKPGSDTYRIKTLPLFIAHVNVSFTLSYMELKGLNNYTINEF